MNDAKRILIVDDDEDQIAILSAELGEAGYEVVTANTQESAEDLLMGCKPDLAVLDLMMEHMDSGLVLSHRIKQLYPDTPVIILTSVASETRLEFDPRTAEDHRWVKAEAWVDKPVRSEQLKGEIGRLLAV
jgi:CheY-like chemotaxis protein